METLLFVSAAVLGGAVKGFTGFGYALVATSFLSLYLDPGRAVAVMIVPMFAANLDLLVESGVRNSMRKLLEFRSLMIGLFPGVVLGTMGAAAVPEKLLRVVIGAFAIGFTLSRAGVLSGYFESFRKVCFRPYESVIGAGSGLIYGSMNIGLPFVTYLKSRDMPEEQFRSVLAATVLAGSLIRIPLASGTGLYSSTGDLVLSLAISAPAVVSVSLASRLSAKVPSRLSRKVSLALIAAVGLRLLTSLTV